MHVQADSENQDAIVALDGYGNLSLPDLSHARNPSPGFALIESDVHPECTEGHLVAALARCLGAYCAVNDVLLGWPTSHDSRAVRVRWQDTTTWDQVIQGLSPFPVSENELRSLIGIQNKQSPFGALVASASESEANVDHPLVASLSGSRVSMKFSTETFHDSVAKVLLSQVREIIARAIEQPDQSMSLSFLSSDLLSRVDLTPEVEPYTHIPNADFVTEFLPLHDPDAIVLEYHPDLSSTEGIPQTLSYRELRSLSNQFARYLLNLGLKLEDKVVVSLPKCLDLYVAMMGIWKAGGCYVPVDPDLPLERREFIVKDSNAQFIINIDNVRDHLDNVAQHSTEDINVAQLDALSYMLYTSGTTGTPKGCLLTQRGLTQALMGLSFDAKFNDCENPRFLAVAAIAFDVHISEFLLPCALGMTHVVVPRTQVLEDLALWIRKLRITHFGTVPSLIEATLIHIDDADFYLRYISCGGEKMTDTILDRWGGHPVTKLMNYYGPSEVTIGCSAKRMSPNTRKESIGRIFNNSSAYVVDENLELVIRGAAGELLVGGPLVGRGYHERDDLTKKAFVTWEGMKLYRTGDLVRLMPDDSMEMLGRIDTQIKLRGVRIEVEGISSVVRSAAMKTPGLSPKTKVDVCTILGRHPSIQSDQLVSFVTWTVGASISERRSRQPKVLQESPKGMVAAIKDACKSELASYMRPAHIIFVEFLPLNSNGKTDARALDSIFTSQGLEVLSARSASANEAQSQTDYHPSRPPTELEKEVIDIVSDLSSIPQSSINLGSNLFELGFDSLKFIGLTAALRSKFSLTAQRWSVTEVMSSESILQLCSTVSSRLVIDSKPERVSSNSSEAFIAKFEARMRPRVEDAYNSDFIDGVYPTFPLQDGVLYRSSSDDTLYIQHVIMKIGNGTSASRLKGAWEMVQRRHEILRTVFYFSDTIAQVVLKADHCTLPWKGVTNSATEDSRQFSTIFYDDQSRDTESDINTNISTKPPFRLLLVKDGTTTHVVLSIHHAIFDAHTLDLLFADVERVYHEQALEDTASLSESLCCIYDMDAQKAEQFWRGVFEDFKWPRMAPVASKSERFSTLDITLNARYEDLLAKATKARITLSSLCTVAFAVCLARHVYGDSDLVFGTITSGRSYADKKYDDAQCPLLAVIPTRVQLNRGAAVLQDLQRDAIEALAYSHVALGRIQQWVRPGHQLFEILFSMAIEESNVPSLWDVVSSTQPAADFPLAVEVRQDKEANEMHLNAAFAGIFKESIIWQILQEFEGVLISLTAEASSNPLESFGPSTRPNAIITEHSSYVEEDDGIDSQSDVWDEELECKLREMVSRFLDVSSDKLDANASLVSFGLDSIKSIGLSRALKAEGLKISAVGLMQQSSIRRLARFLQSSSAETAVAERVYTADATEALESRRREIAANVNVHDLQLRHDDSVDLYPTTDLQSGMLSQTINSTENLYIHEFAFKIDAAVDIGRLRDAWIATIQECAILRTSFHFVVETGIWIQAVHSAVDLKWHDLGKPSSKSVAEEAEEFIRTSKLSEEVALSRPPVHFLIRYEEPSSHPSHLILILHHALYDGISIPILKRRVEDHYERHNESQTPSSVVQFHHLLGQVMYQEIHGVDFWTNYVHGHSPQVWPRIIPGELDGAEVAHVITEHIPVSSSKLKDAISKYGVTTQCLGQAVMAERLANIYQSGDVVFGHVLSGRNLFGSEDVVGPMITSVPCRVRLDASLKVDLGIIRSIHWQNVEAGSWQHISLRKIQQGLGIRSLWDTLFVFQSSENLNRSGSQAMIFDDSIEETLRLQYALNVELYQTEDGFVIKAACQSNALTKHGLREFVDDFTCRLLEIIETPLSEDVINPPRPHVTPSQTASLQNGNGVSKAHLPPIALDEHPEYADFLNILSQSTKVPVSSIRTDMSLASMGIDSISSIQIVAKCRASGFIIRAAQILKCDRVSELLDSVSMVKSNGVAAHGEMHALMNGLQHRSKLSRSGNAVESILPSSAGMSWLVAMWQISHRKQFQYCFAYRLANGTSIQRLQQAWIQLTEMHPILRSTFDTTDGSHVQVITFRDLQSEQHWSTMRLQGNIQEIDIVQELTEDMVSNPLSTERPPMRAVLMQGNDSAYLVLHLHHFHYDAWSLSILINDLTSLYSDDKVTLSKQDDMGKFLHYCQPDDAQKSEQRVFWQAHLQVPFVPSLLPKTLAIPEDNKRKVLILPSALKNAEDLREKARQLSISLSALLITCWAHVQAKLCNARDVTFGLWQSGRSSDLEGIESMAIPCMNVLPIRIDSADTLSKALCRSVNAHLRQRSGIVEQTFLEDIRDWTKLDRGPMFNTCLNILDSRADTSANGSKSKLLEPLNIPYYIPDRLNDGEEPGTKTLSICDLVQDSVMAEIIIRGNEIDVSIEYDPSYLDGLGARSLVEDWSGVLLDFLHDTL